MEHNKEPWKAKDENGHYSESEWMAEHDSAGTYESAPIVDANGETVALVVSTDWSSKCLDSNAKRIVSCVNAFAGLSQNALDGGWNYKDSEAYTVKLEKQRDELLSSNKELIDAMIRYEMDVETEAPNAHREMMKRAKDAIAKATA